MFLFYHPTGTEPMEIEVRDQLITFFALKRAVLVNDAVVPEGCFVIISADHADPVIKSLKKNSLVCCLSMSDSTHSTRDGQQTLGSMTSNHYYLILQLLAEKEHTAMAEALGQLLQAELFPVQPVVRKAPSFGVLQKVFAYVESYDKQDAETAGIAPPIPLDKKSFQLGCRYLYQRSFKEISRRGRLATALQNMLNSNRSLDQIQQEAGYDHGPSFRMAFYNQFGVRPEDI